MVARCSGAMTPSWSICSSCEQFCAGDEPSCSVVPGPEELRGVAPYGVLRNWSTIRMTAASVLDLTNKNSGTAAGDLVFVQDETSNIIMCRHNPKANRSSMCDAKFTPSWLPHQPLVFVKVTVESLGLWGPYRKCNLNTSAPDPHADSAWKCAGHWSKDALIPRTNASSGCVNATDAAICGQPACRQRMYALPGAETTLPPWRPQRYPLPDAPASCVRALTAQCAAAAAFGHSACLDCWSVAGPRVLANGSLPECLPFAHALTSTLRDEVCGAPPPLVPACRVAVGALCGALVPPGPPPPGGGFPNTTAGLAAFQRCAKCLVSNVTHPPATNGTRPPSPFLPDGGPCAAPASAWTPAGGDDSWALAVAARTCGAQPAPDPNRTWASEFLVNEKATEALLEGSWISTPAAGECATGLRPGDGRSNCTWRAVATETVVNYTCANSRVGAAVIGANPACFAPCPDGRSPFPRNATDCWLRCYFNTLLGNATYGLPGMNKSDVVAPFERAFAPEEQGGCPDLRDYADGLLGLGAD